MNVLSIVTSILTHLLLLTYPESTAFLIPNTRQLDRDYDMKEEHKKAVREEAMEDIKRSWERHVHLKRLRALAKEGPAAIREYAVG